MHLFRRAYYAHKLITLIIFHTMLCLIQNTTSAQITTCEKFVPAQKHIRLGSVVGTSTLNCTPSKKHDQKHGAFQGKASLANESGSICQGWEIVLQGGGGNQTIRDTLFTAGLPCSIENIDMQALQWLHVVFLLHDFTSVPRIEACIHLSTCQLSFRGR